MCFASRSTDRILLALGCLLCLWGMAPSQVLAAIEHRVDVSLHPNEGRVEVQDVITLGQDAAHAEGWLLLPAGARNVSLRIAGWRVHVEDSQLRDGRLPLPETPQGSFEVAYSVSYDDQPPEAPFAFDNPGFGVGATVSERGVMLLGGSGWHLRVAGGASCEQSYTFTIDAPQGMVALTEGDYTGHATRDGRTISTSRVGIPLPQYVPGVPAGVALVAGRYTVQERETPAGTVRTFLLQGEDDAQRLAATYLDAASRWLVDYHQRYGNYPLQGYSVVENFFPTGYGMVGFTLLGGRVLRLPFIPYTSLRHEVAHSWWGNGVYVDYARGNWCEGLATYVADYARTVEEGPQAALEYRRKVLYDWARLVEHGRGGSLRGFTSRTSPQTRALGYGKAMFVFSMLNDRLNGALESVLAGFYADYLFREASWDDILDMAVTHGGMDPDEAAIFLAQWVDATEVPRLALENISKEPLADGGWQVRGDVVQQQDTPFALTMTVQATAHNGLVATTRVALSGTRTPFALRMDDAPQAVHGDPQARLFRRLEPDEVPASVNSIKGAGQLVVVLAERFAGQPYMTDYLARGLAASLSHPRARVVAASSLSRLEPGVSYLLVGTPTTGPAAGLAAKAPAVDAQQPVAAAFSTFTHTGTPHALFTFAPGLSQQSVETIARKITHYGTYGQLAFAREPAHRNIVKTINTPQASPLRHTFAD